MSKFYESRDLEKKYNSYKKRCVTYSSISIFLPVQSPAQITSPLSD